MRNVVAFAGAGVRVTGRAECPHGDKRPARGHGPCSLQTDPNTYIHLPGRDLADKLSSGMEHVHAWRIRMLASAGELMEVSRGERTAGCGGTRR